MTKLTVAAKTTRRRLLQGAAGFAGLAWMPSLAFAQAKGQIVVGTWGGDYARLLRKNIEDPTLIPAGWEVIQDQAGDPERRGKMAAERRLPRGTTDLQGLSAVNMFQVHQQGLTKEIDYSRLENGQDILAELKYPHGVAHIYSGMVPVYNPDKIDPPKSFAEVFDGKWGDRLGIIDIQYQYTLVAAALAAGSTPSDLEPGQPLLLDVRKAGARIYPTNEAFAQGLKTEEFDVGIMWKARTVQWQNADINVAVGGAGRGGAGLRLGILDPEERAQRRGRLRLSRRHARAGGPGGLRARHGLQPDGDRRRSAGGAQRADRLHGGGGQEASSTSTTLT